ncbi:MAG TPA: response regulator [Anaerolineae bacterium]|nr:response regulator [Anaerolineae bacterium]
MEISTQDKRGRRKGRILVYDDDRLLLDVLVTMLRREGHQVTATHSEQEAMALARAQHFDLAVVDLGRQRSKGYDLVGVVSATSPDTPVVAMSAYPAQEVVRFAREHAQAFLEKPFSLAELVDVVRCILAQGQWAGEIVREDYPAAPGIRVAARPLGSS